MLSVSSLASEGFLYYRRPRAEFLFTRALAMDSLGSSSNMIGVDSSSEEPPSPSSETPSDRWLERHEVGSCSQEFTYHVGATGKIARYEIHIKLTRFFNRVTLHLFKTQEDRTGLLGLVHDLGDLTDNWNPECFWLRIMKLMSEEISRAYSEACSLLALPWVYQHGAVFLKTVFYLVVLMFF